VTLKEQDLEFEFTGSLNENNFDDGITHSSSSIQPVDFIVEYNDCYRFIEIKDPDIPNSQNIESFKEKLKSGQLIRSLAGKYRDSIFFHRNQSKKEKEIEYIVLLSMNSLDDALLLAKQDELIRSIPINHKDWQNKSASKCAILNINQWKKHYGENSVRRISQEAS